MKCVNCSKLISSGSKHCGCRLQTCKQCHVEFRVSRGNRTLFCSRKCSANWRIDNYQPPDLDFDSPTWNLIGFSHRAYEFRRGSFNYWKVSCKNCGMESVKSEVYLLKSFQKCQHCKNINKGCGQLNRNPGKSTETCR